MALAKLLDEAASRLDEATFRIDAARAKPFDQECAREWLDALAEYCVALNDIQRLNNESVHEKLHTIAGRLRLEGLL